MSADRDVTRIVRSWLKTGEHESASRVLASVLDRLAATPQRRPLWRAWRDNVMSNTLRWAAVAAMFIVVASVGVVLYFSRPVVTPGPSLSPSAPPTTPSFTPTSNPTQPVSAAPWVIFRWHVGGTHQIQYSNPWVMRADGSQARELWDRPFASIAWTWDGSRLVAIDDGHIYTADVGDEIGEFVDTGLTTGKDTACDDKPDGSETCADSAVAVSPDGSRIVFVQRCTGDPGCVFLTTVDLTNGVRNELERTFSDSRVGLERPKWSSDGRLTFTRLADIDANTTSLYVVDAGESSQSGFVVDDLFVSDAVWSPDNREIAFVGIAPGGSSNIWTVHDDGTDLTQRTHVGSVDSPDWISADEIRFRDTTSGDLSARYSVVERGHLIARPFADLGAAIASLGVDGELVLIGMPGDPGRLFLWQPVPR